MCHCAREQVIAESPPGSFGGRVETVCVVQVVFSVFYTMDPRDIGRGWEGWGRGTRDSEWLVGSWSEARSPSGHSPSFY